jgi:hypothetical protein
MEYAITELARRLHDAPLSGSRNSISLDELKKWAVEYLDEYDDELARFPKLVGQPHWNLWMIDMSIPDALFAVLVFRPDGLEFFCGTGDGYKIREFSEHEIFESPGEMLLAMNQRFRIPESALVLDRSSAEEWLGRSW